MGFLVDWLSRGKYEVVLYLQKWAVHISAIVTFRSYVYNLLNQPFNFSTVQPGLSKVKMIRF